MKTNSICIFIIACFLVFNLSPAFALPSINTKESQAGHSGLTSLSVDIKRNLADSASNGLMDALGGTNPTSIDTFKNSLSSSNVAEDQPGIKGMFHFYDPNEKSALGRYVGDGYLGVFENAKSRGTDFYRFAINDYCIGKYRNDPNLIKKAWSDFGHVQHLMQDMTTPSHTKYSSHITGDSYEEYVANNWDHWDPNPVVLGYERDPWTDEVTIIRGPLPDEAKIMKSFDANGPVYYTGLKEYLEDYMQKVPYKPDEDHPSPYQRSEYFDFLSKQSSEAPVDTSTTVVLPSTLNEQISWQQRRQNAEKFLPMAMMYSAGLINSFWKDISTLDSSGIPAICKVPPALITPGGDHPDDRFDVSDGFYLEQNFNLSFDRLTDLHLRTGMKKGKTGLIYYKQAIDAYTQGVNAITDVEKSAAQKKLNEIGKITIPNATKFQDDFKTAPDVALFSYGFNDAMTSLLLKYKEPVTFIATDFSPAIIKDLPLMLIPSGGLYGLENSTFLKVQLDEYVKNGGTLIVFAQQHGYEFGVLPTPVDSITGQSKPITGYGWGEDQSCFTNAVYIDTQHQMLSSISKATPTLSVDGYFTSYPSNTTVLLRRTANGQPAMIMYEHGLGKVIVTSMYSDFAMSRSQASSEELVLVRDMVSWAKKPAVLPEIRPGQTVDLTMEMKNSTDTAAASAKLYIYNPDRTTVVSNQVFAISIPVGQSAQLSTSYSSPLAASLGIYHIDYELYDANGSIIQPQAETDSGRFVISNPPKTGPPNKPVWFSVSTPAQEVLFGTPFDYTFHVFNNTAQTRTLKIKSVLPHTNRTREWNITATPNGETSITDSDLFLDSYYMYETMRAYLYDETGREIGSYLLSFKGFKPSANISTMADKLIYAKGETVILNTSIRNNKPLSYRSVEKITITDPSYAKVFEETKPVSLSSYGTVNLSSSFALPQTAATGTYTVRSEAWYGTMLVSAASTSIELAQSQISVAPNLQALATGPNTIPFVLNNTGKIPVSSGVLDISIKDPDGTEIYTGSQTFAIQKGENQTINLPVTLPVLKAGTYTLTYKQSDETRTGSSVALQIKNATLVSVALDKGLYKIGETANIGVDITNTGKFVQEGTVTISAPFLGFSDTKTITLNPDQQTAISYNLAIPDTLQAGGAVTITFTTSAGTIEKTIMFNVQPIGISQTLSFDKTSYRIRELLGMNFSITANNFAGQLPATYSISIPDLNYSSTGQLILVSGAAASIPLATTIPETLPAGMHQVVLSLTLPSGLVHTKTVNFTVPEPFLSIAYEGAASLNSGDTTSLMINNIGGVDTSYELYIYLMDKSDNYPDSQMLSGTLAAGSSKAVVYAFPEQIQEGTYTLLVSLSDTHNDRWSYANYPFSISGLRGELSVRTDKDVYFFTDSTSTLSTVTSQNKPLTDGNLHLEIICANPVDVSEQNHFILRPYCEGCGYVEISMPVFPKIFIQQEVPLPAGMFESGYLGLRIDHRGRSSAYVDYLAVKDSKGNVYRPFYALLNMQERDITEEILSHDDWYVRVRNESIILAWRDLPLDETFSLVMVAKENEAGCGLLWQTDLPVNQAPDNPQPIVIPAGVLNQIGKFYLRGRLANVYGQTLAQSEYPFYIYGNNTLLRLTTDKKIYKPGESMRITGNIENRSAADMTDIELELTVLLPDRSNEVLLTDISTLPAGGTRTFEASAIAANEGLIVLSGIVSSNFVDVAFAEEQYEIAAPYLEIYIDTPDVVGSKSFPMGVWIWNWGKVDASVRIVASSDTGGYLADQEMTIPAGQSRLLNFTQQIAGETTYTVECSGNFSTVTTKTVGFGEKAEIQLSTMPVYKEGRLTIPFTLTNTGVLETEYPLQFTLMKGGQQISTVTSTVLLPVGGSSSGVLGYDLSEGIYALYDETTGFSDDYRLTVVKSGSTEFSLAASPVYPEGMVRIPVTITNTGQFEETVTATYQLSTDSAQQSIPEQIKTYYLPIGGTVTDILYYELAEGSYQHSALSSQPQAAASTAFAVRKEIKADISLAVGVQTNGLVPVTVNLSNLGYAEINGSIQLSVLNSQGVSVWIASQSNILTPGNLSLTVFNINPSALTPGAYTLRAELLDSSNRQIAISEQPLTIKGPVFQITQLPSYRTFTTGQEAEFVFKIKNTGSQEGAIEFKFKAYDLINSTRTEWLKPGEEKEISFALMLPEDIETKDYFADYTLTPALSPSGEGIIKGQVKYKIAGINLNVTSALDRQNYSVGDTVHLTLNIQSPTPNPQSLFARVNYAGFEDQKTFTLNGSTTLTVHIPLSQITGEKLFYGIYHESGRSIHLNSLYIHKTGDVITITTNKQVYNPGETVSVAISSQQSALSGTMTLTGPGYSETFAFSGTALKTFALPLTMTAGTYSVSADLSAADGTSYSESHAIDIAGIQVKVLECKNDNGKYAASDTIATEFTISSNSTMPAVLKTWIVDPEGKYTQAGEAAINLSSSDPLLVTHNASLVTAVSGIHRLVYGIYSGDLLLVSGSEAFDVGDAVLIGLKTDKTDYPTNTESVKATATIYGSVPATIELQLDGTNVKNESVVIDGFSGLEMDLGSVTPGTHVLKGILTVGGLKSTKETSFVYGSNLPDLTPAISYQQSAISNDITVAITATAANQGRTAAAPTTMALYNGDTLIETKQVSALNTGETQDVTFIWNVLGKTGPRTLKAVVDPDNLVIEFNETNNTAVMNIEIPDLSLVTGTDKDIYKINQNVQISSAIRNLSSEKTFSGLTLITTAKDSSGIEVYTNTAALTDILPLGTKTDTATWNTTGLTAEGVYAISQQLLTGAQVLAQSAKTVTLKKVSDFSVTIVSDHLSARQGEQATFMANLAPLNGWLSPIMLSLTGLPASASASFNPGNLVPPGQTLIVITTSNTTPASSYTLTLTADGTDDGDRVTHTLPLILDVSDTIPPTGSLMINNNDAFTKTATVALTLHATDESGVAKICISNSSTCTAWENYATSRSWSLSSGDESKTVSVWYQDSVGNSNALPYTATITLDTTAPVMTVSTLADNRWTNNELLNISGEATDESGIQELTINGVPVTVNSDGTFSCPVLLADGPNTLVTKATDLAGNEAFDTRTINFDRNSPNITILTPADNLKTNQPAVNVTGAVDEASTVSIKVDGSTPLAALMNGNSFSLMITPNYGINTIEATATDLAGNSASAKRTVTFDNVKPLLSVTDPAQDVKTNQTNMIVKGEVQDLTSLSLTVTMDGYTYSPIVSNGRFEQPVVFSEQMTYQINVEAVDEAGNVSSVQRHVLYDTTGPLVTLNPVTSPTSQTNQVLTGTMETGTTVSATCTTATVSTVTYPTATTWSVTLSGMQQGNNTITVTAMDEIGNVSMPVSGVISVHLPSTSIMATIDFDPNTLNQKSKGNWVTVYIELPVGYNVANINITSLRLNGTILAETWPYAIGNYDRDGIPDLMVKFDRNAVINLLPNGDRVKVAVTGTVGATIFEGVDYLRVIH